MQWLDVVSRIVHVGTAIMLVGGSAFTLLILLPSTRELADDVREKLGAAVTRRWKRFVHLGIVLFLASGFYNYFRAMPNHKGDGLYHALVGTKILIALFVFFLAAALVGRSPALQGIRRQRGKWTTVMVFLAAVIVCISSFVKIRG